MFTWAVMMNKLRTMAVFSALMGLLLAGCSGFITKGYVVNKYYMHGYTSWVTIPHSNCTRVSKTTSICTYWSTHIPVYHYPEFTFYLSSCYPPADKCDSGSI